MATKLKDIPFETLMPTIVPMDELPAFGEPAGPDSSKDLAAVIGARSLQMLDLQGRYSTVVSPGYQGSPDVWFFEGVAQYTDCAADAGYAQLADRAGYADYACEADDAAHADYACEADDAAHAYYADYVCVADYACEADDAAHADYAGEACWADHAGYADRTDVLGYCDSIYSSGEHLIVSIGDFAGCLSLRRVSELQDSDPYVLVVV